uniref:Uncharacterized protein n=1 Tax=Kalanchoe fedtschenkoi TaxID=63787 RepID=A0A7N0V6G9_KALFE
MEQAEPEGATIIMVVKCDCCGLKEDCTECYINQVKSAFEGKWLCGLCSEAVRDEASRRNRFNSDTARADCGSTEDAVQAHMSFCGKYRSNNPAIQVADGMKQMLRRMSPSTSPTAASKGDKKFARSVSMSSAHYYC